MRELRDQELSREEMTAKFQEIRAEGDKKLLAVLTSEQQTQYEALKGEPVEIDMSQFARVRRRTRSWRRRRTRPRSRQRQRYATRAFSCRLACGDQSRETHSLTPIKTQSVQGNELRRFRDDSASLCYL